VRDEDKEIFRTFDYRLDILRFTFFLLVFICHFVANGGNGISKDLNVWWTSEIIRSISNFGREGVTLFFVLSGFLLCRLLINEFKTYGDVIVSNFILRRIYRIWPLYFLFLLILALINLFTENTGFSASEIPYLLTFSYNWGITLNNLGGSIASITWSLSIEEQIYILLALVGFVKLKNRFLIGSICFFSLGTISLIYCNLYSIKSLYLTTSYLIPFSVGMLIALNENWFRVKSIKYRLLTFGSILFVFLYPAYYDFLQNSNFHFTLFYLSSIFFVCLLHICDRFLSANSLLIYVAKIGRLTYGCYLYHFIILFAFIRFNIFFGENGFSILGVMLALALTIIVSNLSYFFFEIHFLRKRRKYFTKN